MGLFGDDPEPGAAVTRLTPDKSSALWVHVVVGRRRVARVPAARVDALGLKIGAPWSAPLAERAALAVDVLRAKLKAVALLKKRGRSSADLASRLVRQGFSREAVGEAISELIQEKMIDDEAFAQALAQRSLSQGRARPAISDRLIDAGLTETQAAAALMQDSGPGDLLRAIEQARNRIARMPESLGASAKYRRAVAALARLGYPEEVAREAASSVLSIHAAESPQASV